MRIFCRFALDMLAPPRCRACGRSLWGCEPSLLCPECVGKIHWITPEAACRRCGFPVGRYAHAGQPGGCPRCRDRKLDLDGVAAVARYGAGAKHFVRLLKFRGERRLAPAMGKLMAERVRAAGLSGKFDLVVPVPLHPARLRIRGFNQSGLLAAVIAETLGAALDADALRRTRPTKPQSLLRRAERLKTMAGVFEATPAVNGKHILLVDDVFTTGSTMSAAGAACRRGGAENVYGISFAR